MKIQYRFDIEGTALEYEVDVDRHFDFNAERQDAPEWAKLKHNQCPNCPLTVKDCQYCPVAIDLSAVVTDFQQMPAQKTAMVRVSTPEREYKKETRLEEGLRSLMGLIMGSSACPILTQLKPNARNHLPFASQDDFIIRSTALYLLKQYFNYREGKRPDWELQGLISLNQELQTLNEAFWGRVKEACEGDSNLQALLSFLDMSSSVSYSLEAQLQKVKPLMTDEDISPAIAVRSGEAGLF
ncbi:DUF6901 family protein [Ketobacter sp.]|uniref:DUF6901 family protein n=1 Tax=Ketobacter sp. TaxID=2083498 RepID=UPI000F103D79|nr:hypothetical protein [Ketobacter sp.]RLT93477.1 MAG: hypothetical protein D9N14_18425 [Ketobacter sp.]